MGQQHRQLAALVEQVALPALEATHGLRPARQLRRTISPALEQAMRGTATNIQVRLPIQQVGPLRVAMNSRNHIQFSGTYRTVDGSTHPVAGEFRRGRSTALLELVALETANLRHTQKGPRPPALQQGAATTSGRTR